MKFTTGLVICFSLLISVMATDVGGHQSSDTLQPLIVGTKESPPFSMKTLADIWENNCSTICGDQNSQNGPTARRRF